jgi:hypothetical protein
LGAVDRLHHLEQTDPLGRSGEAIAAAGAGNRCQQLGRDQRLEVLQEIALRDAVIFGQRLTRQRRARLEPGKHDRTVDAPLDAFAQPHDRLRQ